MKDIRYVCYSGNVYKPSDEIRKQFAEDIKAGIDINRPSVEIITYKDFLSKKY